MSVGVTTDQKQTNKSLKFESKYHDSCSVHSFEARILYFYEIPPAANFSKQLGGLYYPGPGWMLF
jgi:hypothetical protein